MFLCLLVLSDVHKIYQKKSRGRYTNISYVKKTDIWTNKIEICKELLSDKLFR